MNWVNRRRHLKIVDRLLLNFPDKEPDELGALFIYRLNQRIQTRQQTRTSVQPDIKPLTYEDREREKFHRSITSGPYADAIQR